MKPIQGLLLAILLTIIIATGFACSGSRPTGAVVPLSAPTNTPTVTSTPTSTPTCAITPVPYTGAAPTGIFWDFASVSGNLNYGTSGASVQLSVNGYQETTAGVTLTGSDSTSAPMTYSGPITMGSSTYSNYLTNAFTYTAGVTYTLTTATSIGTASASLPAPGNFTFAPDGSYVSWTTDATYEPIYLRPPGGNPYWQPLTCNHQPSPASIPVTAYAFGPGNYELDANFSNATTVINNGTGLYEVSVYQGVTIVK
jgi:hypothetical protein